MKNYFTIQESKLRLDINFFDDDNDETLAHAAQRTCGCPIPRSVEGQVKWDFDEPDLMKDALEQGNFTR